MQKRPKYIPFDNICGIIKKMSYGGTYGKKCKKAGNLRHNRKGI